MKVSMDEIFDGPAAQTNDQSGDDKKTAASHLEDIFRSIESAIVAFSNDLEVVGMNEAARKLCRFSLVNKQEAFHCAEKPCTCRCRDIIEEAARENRSVNKTFLECMPSWRPEQIVSVRSFPLLDPGKTPKGTVVVIEDETPVVAGTYSQGLISFPHIIGKSPAMRKLYDLVGCLADVPTTVLITGESGTGKELVAEALHHGGVRRNGPLVKVNCAALSETLLESELFGHVRGAFTGADKDRAGRFQMADGGTIFLDEIGDISAGVQARLLRILESMELERVGDSTPMKIDVRIIAATNKDMPEQIQNGSFRKDLYYRLKVVDIPILPLRERKEDIPLLVEHFIGKLNAKLNKTIQGVSSDVMKIFNGYGWPGNVRELEHAVEHAFIHCRLPIVTVCDLPHDIREFIKTKTTLLSYRGCDERQAILRTLEATRWNKTRAAELLGMSRRTFYRKIKEHNIFR